MPSPFAVQLFELAVTDVTAPSLWLSFAQYAEQLADADASDDESDDSSPDDAATLVRGVYERAVAGCGAYTNSGELWNGFLRLEIDELEDAIETGNEDEKAMLLKRIRELYRRRLALPIEGNAEAWSVYEGWERDMNLDDSADAVRAVKALYQKSEQQLKQRKPFEKHVRNVAQQVGDLSDKQQELSAAAAAEANTTTSPEEPTMKDSTSTSLANGEDGGSGAALAAVETALAEAREKLSSAWRVYIGFEKKRDDPARVQLCYERALTAGSGSASWDGALWEEYMVFARDTLRQAQLVRNTHRTDHSIVPHQPHLHTYRRRCIPDHQHGDWVTVLW